ncbi:unnamed protein product [Cyprideis torosa]|uniref:CLIP domain-containing serine protease n=1 Tax=Cyprideis torosa TaxID=163714 RepID=A0A7R8ZNE3_9CRUS|nr:unnamed protein product [Cyprideis torosa]CAG0886147.1 unnamed protein product [Cyprideis torosa]
MGSAERCGDPSLRSTAKEVPFRRRVSSAADGIRTVAIELLGVLDAQGLTKGDACKTVRNNEGLCYNIEVCPLLQRVASILKNDQTARELRETLSRVLQKSVCGYDESLPLVCCPKDGIIEPPAAKHEFVDRCVSGSYHGKIVGGSPAEVGSWPWAATLGIDDGGLIVEKCGGTLIADGWILTAAHCVVKETVLGDHDIFNLTDVRHIDYPPKRVIPHPQYRIPESRSNDIALIEFDNSQGYTDAIFPACLPFELTGTLEGHTPFAIGWGTVGFKQPQSDVLREVQLTVISNSVCEGIFKRFKDASITEQHLCAYQEGKDTCQGDSGGGLFLPIVDPEDPGRLEFQVIGVVSFGFRCGVSGFPGVYTRVTEYLDWIEQHIN